MKSWTDAAQRSTQANIAARLLESIERTKTSKFWEDGEYFYVPKRTIETVKMMLINKQEITAGLVDELAFHDGLQENEVMVPIDMRGAGNCCFDDVETMVQKVGLKGAAEAFVKAWGFFERNKEAIPLAKRPTNITSREWRAILEDNLQEGDDDLEDGEEEEPTNDRSFEAALPTVVPALLPSLVPTLLPSLVPTLVPTPVPTPVSTPVLGVSNVDGDRPLKIRRSADPAAVERLADPTVIGKFHTGVVKTYIPTSGFGFIKSPDVTGDIYFSKHVCRGLEHAELRDQRVSFELSVAPDGKLRAANVTLV